MGRRRNSDMAPGGKSERPPTYTADQLWRRLDRRLASVEAEMQLREVRLVHRSIDEAGKRWLAAGMLRHDLTRQKAATDGLEIPFGTVDLYYDRPAAIGIGRTPEEAIDNLQPVKWNKPWSKDG